MANETSASSKSISTGDTGTPDTAAKLRNRVLDMAKKVMRGEERNVFFCELLKMGMGTKELENFVSGQAGLRMSRDECENDNSVFKNEREFVRKAMENKLTDNIANLGKKKIELDKSKKRFAWMVKETEIRRFKNRLREEVGREREKVKIDHSKQLREIRMSRKTVKKEKFKLPPELRRYRQAAIFGKEAEDIFKPGEVLGPVVVGKETDILSMDEVEVLKKGPKFCIRRVLSKEKYMVEQEKTYVKVRWAKRDDEDEEPKVEESDEERKERLRVEHIAEMEAVKATMVFDQDEMLVDFRKQRATNCKHNTYCHLPGPLTAKQEQELEVRRMEWSQIFDEYMANFTDEKGVQESNLTQAEKRGLDSLKKKVKAGDIIIVQTDKSGRFAVMSKEEYERAGRKHTDKDIEVDLNFLLENQKRINGHISMLVKVFMVGANQKHHSRIRALRITHSLSVAPLYLLFKDHKGWTLDTGTAAPTRPVVSAGSGQNDHLSELISQALEPVANTWKGGMEVPSTGAFLDKINTINDQGLGFEEVDLEEIDNAMERQELEAQKRYDNFEREIEQIKTATETDQLVGESVKEPSGTPGGVKNMDPIAVCDQEEVDECYPSRLEKQLQKLNK